MAQPLHSDDHPPAVVHTSVRIDEHEWLHRVFRSPNNTSPRFRFPDLLSACVSLAVASGDGHQRLVEHLTQLSSCGKGERRSCDIWPAQFEQLMEAHRAPWNRFPHPMFELDALTTGCVALAMALPDGEEQVLRMARENWLARARAARTTSGSSPC